jgi:hypothetical protein
MSDSNSVPQSAPQEYQPTGHGNQETLPLEQRRELYKDYELVFSLYRTDIDIHYRRAQMMLVLQTALFGGFFLGHSSDVLLLLICVLGILAAFFWRWYAISQRQFMELRKRMMRSIESRIRDGIDMMTIDKEVFFDQKQHHFAGSREFFPDSNGEFARKAIKGQTTTVEIVFSSSILVVWITLFMVTVLLGLVKLLPWLSRVCRCLQP